MPHLSLFGNIAAEKDFAGRDEWRFCFNNHQFARDIHLLRAKRCSQRVKEGFAFLRK